MSCNMGSCERSAGMCLVGRSKTELRMTCLSICIDMHQKDVDVFPLWRCKSSTCLDPFKVDGGSSNGLSHLDSIA